MTEDNSLIDIASGNLDVKDEFIAIITASKVSSVFLKDLVTTLRGRKISDTDILELIVAIDADVESGKMKEADLYNF
jgi:hypothetical protein